MRFGVHICKGDREQITLLFLTPSIPVCLCPLPTRIKTPSRALLSLVHLLFLLFNEHAKKINCGVQTLTFESFLSCPSKPVQLWLDHVQSCPILLKLLALLKSCPLLSDCLTDKSTGLNSI